MHFTAAIVPFALAFAGCSYGWTQAANGVWVANNNWYNIRGSEVHEACTVMGTVTIITSGDCAYWTDGNGSIFHGQCRSAPGSVACA